MSLAHPDVPLSRSLLGRLRQLLARPFARNSLWMLSDKAGRLLVNFFVGVWIARYLGPTDFGHLQLAITLVAVMSFMSVLGLDQISVRDMATHPQDAPRLLGSLLLLRLLSGGVGYGLLIGLLFAAQPYHPDTTRLAMIIGLSLLFQSADSIGWYFLSRSQSRRSVVAKYWAFAASAAWRVGAAISGASVDVIAVATLIESVLAALFLFWALRRHGAMPAPLSASFALAMTQIKKGLPFCLSSIATLAYMKADQLLIGHVLGEASVGLYAAAARLSEVWYMAPVAIVASAAPQLARLHAQDEAAYAHALRRLSAGLLAMALAIALPVALLAPVIIRLLFGEAYLPAADVLRWHIFTALFVFLGPVQQQYLINAGLGRLQLARLLCGACVCIGLNLLLLPRIGIIGAPIALLAGQCVIVLVFPLLHPRMRAVARLQLQAVAQWRAWR